jgi:small-conductance mechanosensitive channel
MPHLVAFGRFVLALVLAPLLVACLWAEVIAGTGNAWDYAQVGQVNYPLFAVSMGFALCGPLVVVATTIRTRPRISNITSRVLRIEKWGLAIGFPLGLVGLFVTVAQSAVM